MGIRFSAPSTLDDPKIKGKPAKWKRAKQRKAANNGFPSAQPENHINNWDTSKAPAPPTPDRGFKSQDGPVERIEDSDKQEKTLSRQPSSETPNTADGSMPPSRSASGQIQPLQLKFFKLKELAKATANFKEPDMVLGEGGFGRVYKGWIKDPYLGPESVPVAVKRLNPNSFQGQQEWHAEILVLGKLQHPNLVRLVGFCADNGEGLLVYEFMARGSLDYHLFPEADGDASQPVLPWDIRLKIALESAMGLAYLHDNHVIHRDFKAPNILLDENWNAKLTDFGLAKGADSDQTHITTRIMGTMGYLDPKYMETGQLSKKSDVYAFGVMLLELLTGRRAKDPHNSTAPPLTAWAQQFLVVRRPDIFALVDPRLHDQFATKTAQKAAHKLAISAKHCIEEDPSLRPLMSDMVETLRPLVLAATERAAAQDGNCVNDNGGA